MKSSQIARTISALTAMLKKDGRGEIGASKIAGTDIRSRNDDLASFVCRQSFTPCIYDEDFGPRQRASYGQGRIFFQGRTTYPAGSRGDARLCWAVSVPHFSARKMLHNRRRGRS